MMNGGAWLGTSTGDVVDVLLRDLDVVEHWTAEAEAGRFEVDGLLGYVAGIPTYSLAVEAAVAVTVRGAFDGARAFPKLAGRGRARHTGATAANFSLMYAERHASRGNVAGTVGQAALGVARGGTRPLVRGAGVGCSTRSTWSRGVGLDEAADLLGAPGRSAAELTGFVDAAPGCTHVARRGPGEVIPSGVMPAGAGSITLERQGLLT